MTVTKSSYVSIAPRPAAIPIVHLVSDGEGRILQLHQRIMAAENWWRAPLCRQEGIAALILAARMVDMPRGDGLRGESSLCKERVNQKWTDRDCNILRTFIKAQNNENKRGSFQEFVRKFLPYHSLASCKTQKYHLSRQLSFESQ